MKNVGSRTIAVVEGLIRAIEKDSSAEVVVELKWHSGSYAHADLRVAAIAGFGSLLFVLFAPLTFAPRVVPLLVGVSWATGWLLSRSSDSVRRLLTSRRERLANSRMAAAAAFVERGVANTRNETGLLVLFSRLERRIEIVADRGVLDVVPVLEWNQLMEAIGRDATLAELSTVLQQLRSLLARCLPAGAEDVNELPDVVRVDTE